MKNKTHVINYVKEYRLDRGLTQSDLALMCNTTKNTISSIEVGHMSPGIGLALLLAYALEVNLTSLFILNYNDFINLEYRKDFLKNENQSNRN